MPRGRSFDSGCVGDIVTQRAATRLSTAPIGQEIGNHGLPCWTQKVSGHWISGPTESCHQLMFVPATSSPVNIFVGKTVNSLPSSRPLKFHLQPMIALVYNWCFVSVLLNGKTLAWSDDSVHTAPTVA